MRKQPLKKIEAMRDAYGPGPEGKRCGECCCLVENSASRKWFKCLRYGDSAATSTDWRLKYPACGAFNVPFDRKFETTMVEKNRHAPRPLIEPPTPGQITMDLGG